MENIRKYSCISQIDFTEVRVFTDDNGAKYLTFCADEGELTLLTYEFNPYDHRNNVLIPSAVWHYLSDSEAMTEKWNSAELVTHFPKIAYNTECSVYEFWHSASTYIGDIWLWFKDKATGEEQQFQIKEINNCKLSYTTTNGIELSALEYDIMPHSLVELYRLVGWECLAYFQHENYLSCGLITANGGHHTIDGNEIFANQIALIEGCHNLQRTDLVRVGKISNCAYLTLDQREYYNFIRNSLGDTLYCVFQRKPDTVDLIDGNGNAVDGVPVWMLSKRSTNSHQCVDNAFVKNAIVYSWNLPQNRKGKIIASCNDYSYIRTTIDCRLVQNNQLFFNGIDMDDELFTDPAPSVFQTLKSELQTAKSEPEIEVWKTYTIKSWEQMCEEYGTNSNGEPKFSVRFTTAMKDICGKSAEVRSIIGKRITAQIDGTMYRLPIECIATANQNPLDAVKSKIKEKADWCKNIKSGFYLIVTDAGMSRYYVDNECRFITGIDNYSVMPCSQLGGANIIAAWYHEYPIAAECNLTKVYDKSEMINKEDYLVLTNEKI